jgi:hypothetical protein
VNASEGWREDNSCLVSLKDVGGDEVRFKARCALRHARRSVMILPMIRSAESVALACAIAVLAAGVARSAATATDDGPETCRSTPQLLDQAACWWATYMDARFGVTIDYPADLLEPQPSHGEGADHRFVSSDGAVVLSVWGAPATGTLTIAEAMATDLYRSGFETVTERKANASGYVIAGRHGARAFLKRVRWTAPDRKVVETACITWPADRDGELRAIAEKIAATLRDGRGWARNPRAQIADKIDAEGSCRGL